jgi:O-antigen/teichoic acid export membrane protein
VSALRQILSSSGWWLTDRALTLVATLLTSVVLVRCLGPVGYGELSYLLAIVGLLLPVAQLGMSGLVVRALLEAPAEEPAILRTALLVRGAGCLLALLLGASYWALFEPAATSRAVLLVLLLAQCATLFQVLEFWFQARMIPRRLVVWRALVVLAAAGLKMAVALATRRAGLVAAVFALEYLILQDGKVVFAGFGITGIRVGRWQQGIRLWGQKGLLAPVGSARSEKGGQFLAARESKISLLNCARYRFR